MVKPLKADSIRRPRIELTCLTCGARFIVRGPGQRFCSSKCRMLFWAAGEIVKMICTGRGEGLKRILDRIEW